MAEISAFRAVRYDLGAVGDLDRVTSPPYDVIMPEEREALERESPYNVIRLILARDEPGAAPSEKYIRARALLETWLAAGILRADEAPSITVYEQRFTLAGETGIQRGILAAVGLEAEGILPHERTMSGPVEDRLALLRATRANLEPIFGIYDGAAPGARDAIEKAAGEEPLATFAEPGGVEHRLWRMEDPALISAAAEALRPATTVIADGHHRHQTALTYRQERRATDGPGPWDALLMFLVDAESRPALLPIHRVVSGLTAPEALDRMRGALDVEPASTADLAGLAAEVAARRAAGRVFAMADGERAWFLRSSDAVAERRALLADHSDTWRDLDVAVLQGLVFERLLGGVATGFVHSAEEAAAALASGEASLVFLLAPAPYEAVRDIAGRGESMPPKSTYFFPKPRSGVVLRLLD